MSATNNRLDQYPMDATDLEVFGLAAASVFERNDQCGVWPLQEEHMAGRLYARLMTENPRQFLELRHSGLLEFEILRSSRDHLKAQANVEPQSSRRRQEAGLLVAFDEMPADGHADRPDIDDLLRRFASERCPESLQTPNKLMKSVVATGRNRHPNTSLRFASLQFTTLLSHRLIDLARDESTNWGSESIPQKVAFDRVLEDTEAPFFGVFRALDAAGIESNAPLDTESMPKATSGDSRQRAANLVAAAWLAYELVELNLLSQPAEMISKIGPAIGQAASGMRKAAIRTGYLVGRSKTAVFWPFDGWEAELLDADTWG